MPKQKCINGHDYTPINTYRHKKTGTLRCRTCNREDARKRSTSRAQKYDKKV